MKDSNLWTWDISTGTTQTNISWENSLWLDQLKQNLNINPQLTKDWSSYFPISTCNKIIKLYNCIISKAPIENQPVMQKALSESTKSRQLMPDNELRKTCEAILIQEEFIRIKEHYTGEKQKLWCQF